MFLVPARTRRVFMPVASLAAQACSCSMQAARHGRGRGRVQVRFQLDTETHNPIDVGMCAARQQYNLQQRNLQRNNLARAPIDVSLL